MYSLRLATSSTGLGFALGRLGGRSGGGGGASSPVVSARARRTVSATPNSAAPNSAAPTPGEQGVAMEQGIKQQHQPPPAQHQQHQPPPAQHQQQQPHRDVAGGQEEKRDRDDMHKTIGDVMSHSFGEGYSTRSDDEGFGGVYGQNDPVFNPGTEVHPSHPDYDTSQGSEVKEKEKARHLKDDKHAT